MLVISVVRELGLFVCMLLKVGFAIIMCRLGFVPAARCKPIRPLRPIVSAPVLNVSPPVVGPLIPGKRRIGCIMLVIPDRLGPILRRRSLKVQIRAFRIGISGFGVTVTGLRIAISWPRGRSRIGPSGC
jgi:hypothetical protein